MQRYDIAVYAGDGIGPEVIDWAVRVLEAVERLDGSFRLDLTSFDWGIDRLQRTGRAVPMDYLDRLAPFDAILLGAVGWPAVAPDRVTLAPLIGIRQAFDQYACVRPARLLPGLESPLAGKGPADVDMLVVRENSEGEYVNQGGRFRRGRSDEFAVQTALHTRGGIERVLRFGFQAARDRRGRLTMITKSNALGFGFALWDEILARMAPEYPDVAADRQHCDAAVMNFVRQPEQFDVVVASNLFGDILTDLGGVLSGGLGLAPSANLNPQRRFPSMFEPVHGSAPDIAGQGTANPIAAIRSAAMMLDFLEQPDAARRVGQAVETTLASGRKTPDLGGTLDTRQMGQAVLDALEMV